jgi:voltage-gated potassium channel
MSIVDLLAILPSYRPLRILRILLLFRLIKILRYTHSINFFIRIFVEKRFEFTSLLFVFAFLIFTSATVLYIFEGSGQNTNISDFFDSIYWSIITITTVGYGDITPATAMGRAVTVLLILGGIGIISFATSIITNALSEKMEEMKEHRVRNESAKMSSYIMVFGFGRMGKVLCEELSANKKEFIVLDKDSNSVAQAKEKGYLSLVHEGTNLEELKALNIHNNVKSVVILTPNDAINLSILLSVKAINENIEVIVRANEEQNKAKFEIAQANKVVFPYEVAGLVASDYITSPIAYEAIENILIERKDPVMDEFLIPKNSSLVGKKLNQTDIQNYNVKIIGILKENENFLFNPTKEYTVQNEDILVILGNKEDLNSIKYLIIKA